MPAFLFAQEEGTNGQDGQSTFEDKDGETSIFLRQGGTFRLNTLDGSLKLSYSHENTKSHLFYGIDVSGKTHDGILSLFANGKITPGVKANAVIGYKEIEISSKLDAWTYAKIGYEGASFKLFEPDSIFAKQINKKTFNTFVVSGAFNLKVGGFAVFGLGFQYKKGNNYSSLEDIEINEITNYTDSTSNTIRTQEQKMTLKSGDYRVFDQWTIQADAFWLPNNQPRIGFYHYFRAKFQGDQFVPTLGSGIYLLKKNNPLSSIAGIVFEINDLTKINEGFGKSFSVNFVVGYNFASK